VETFFRDVRFALRLFARNPWFAALAIVALALGIGANTAVFSVVHAVLIPRCSPPRARALHASRSPPATCPRARPRASIQWSCCVSC